MTPIVRDGTGSDVLALQKSATVTLFPEDIENSTPSTETKNTRKHSAIPKKREKDPSCLVLSLGTRPGNPRKISSTKKPLAIDRERSPLTDTPVKNDLMAKLPRIPDLVSSNLRRSQSMKIRNEENGALVESVSISQVDLTNINGTNRRLKSPTKFISKMSVQPDVINHTILTQKTKKTTNKSSNNPEGITSKRSSKIIAKTGSTSVPTKRKKPDGIESDSEIKPNKKSQTGQSKKILKPANRQEKRNSSVKRKSAVKFNTDSLPEVTRATLPGVQLNQTGTSLIREHYDIMLGINSRFNSRYDLLPELLTKDHQLAPYQSICYKEFQAGSLKKCTSESCISEFTSSSLEDVESKSITSVDMCHTERVPEKVSTPTTPFVLTDYLELQRYLEEYYQWTASEELYEKTISQAVREASPEPMDVDESPIPGKFTRPVNKITKNSQLKKPTRSVIKLPTLPKQIPASKAPNTKTNKQVNDVDKTRNSTPTKRKNLETVKIKNLRNSNLQNSQRISDPVKVAKPSIVNGSQLRSSLPPQQTKRHEALLAAKNAELLVAREESRKAQTGIEALSVLIQHLTTKYEPFKTAHFKKKIDNLCNELTNLRLCLDESKANVQRLEDEASRRCQLHTEEVLLLQEKLTQETQTLKDDHEQEIFNINQSHQRELRKVTEDHETQLTCKTKEHESKLETVDTEWRKQMEEQHHRHLHAQEQLSSCHKQQLDEAEKRWASEHKTLEEVNSKLKNDNKHLKEQAKTLEQTLLSDKDSKLQAAKRVCTGLQSEVDSLKTVLDMRNAELHRLRDQVADKERLCEDLDSSREKVRFLRAKTEDLQAQMQTKSEIEKQRMAEYMKLHESHQRELALNQTLNHHNEELQWKLRQRGDFSVSLPNTTPDSTHRLSRSTDNQSWTKLSTSTPRMNSQGSNRRTANKNQENDSEYSMESPPLSPCVKGFLEKSTSVSFTYNLNDPACEDDLRDISISPIHRKGSRTVTRKRAPPNQLEKSMSSPYVSGRTAKVKTSSRNGTKACTSTPRPKSLHFKGAKVNGTSNKLSEEPLFRRSTSESSDGDPDRLSPTAWSIQSNCSNKSFGQEGQKPSFLQHAEEDEYEESDEFVQVLDLTDGLNGGSLSAILGNTPTSISLSDSDASQCGSRLELTDDTDDDTELDWVPQQDAGEAMVPQGPDATNQASSVVSSDSEEPKNGITWSPEQSCELTSSSEMQDLL